MRVWIVNTDKMEPTETAIEQALAGEDLSQMAIAMPMFGTTLTHYALLWETLGEQGLKEWHRDLVERGCRVVSGNATVKNLVAEGTCTLGMTDTDDYFVAKDEDKPVAQLPIRIDGRTICIPNTVAIIKGTDNLAEAQRLVDYLTSAETELALARSGARQIPLGQVDESQVPDDVRPLAEWAQDSFDTSGLGPARAACLEWLKAEYAP
jgi:iron(III) transport system substrate-binding protein